MRIRLLPAVLLLLSACTAAPSTSAPSREVPGGPFLRSSDPSAPATVSPFLLDTHPITVARFRAFVTAGQGTRTSPPLPGAGSHSLIPNSGWDPTWDARLVATPSDLLSSLHCGGESWTDSPSANEALPINCINWFEAFAFCAWDGGRLPTEAEWNFAASGGDQQRVYPWSDPPTSTTIDDTYAVYCGETCALQPVGSRSPKGDGRWGHSELAGGVWEWNLDWWEEPYVVPCVDCAVVTPSGPESLYRVARGGGFKSLPPVLVTSLRVQGTPSERDSFFGARCARDARP